MSYYKVKINGRIQLIHYLFYNDAATKVESLHEPLWIYKTEIGRYEAVVHKYYLADEKYLAVIIAQPDDKANLRLNITISPLDAGDAMDFKVLAGYMRLMQDYWQHDDVAKGGDYNKLVKLKEKLEVTAEQMYEEWEERLYE